MLTIVKILPPLFAILFCVFFLKRLLSDRNHVYSIFVSSLAFISGCEIILHVLMRNMESYDLSPWGRLYYVAATLCVVSYVAAVLKVTDKLPRLLVFLLMLVSGVWILVLAGTDFIVSGVTSIGYSVTRIEGPYYKLFQLFVLSSSLFALIFLARAYFVTDDWIKRRNILVLLLATVLLIGCSLIVVVMMMVGFKVNATIILPSLTIVTITMLAHARYEGRLFRILSFVPKTSEYAITLNTVRAFLKGNSHGLQSAVNEFERGIIRDVLLKCGGNKTEAAKQLGISRATLRRKLGEDEALSEEVATQTESG